MRFPIGSMSVGDILDRALKVLLARLPVFYVVNLVALSPMLLWMIVRPALFSGAQAPATPEQFQAQLPSLMLIGGATFLAAIVLSQIANAATLHVIAQEFADRHVGIGEALSFALQRFVPLFGASMLAGLAIGIGFMLCIVPGVIFVSWYLLVAQIVVVEGLSGTAALNRSKQLTEGYRNRVWTLIILLFVFGLVLGFGLQFLEKLLPSAQLVRTDQGVRAVPNYFNYYLNLTVSQLLNVLVQTYGAVCITLMYFDLRIRKEGYDLELAAQQLGELP